MDISYNFTGNKEAGRPKRTSPRLQNYKSQLSKTTNFKSSGSKAQETSVAPCETHSGLPQQTEPQAKSRSLHEEVHEDTQVSCEQEATDDIDNTALFQRLNSVFAELRSVGGQLRGRRNMSKAVKGAEDLLKMVLNEASESGLFMSTNIA